MSPSRSLAALATISEDVRQRCDSIVHKTDHLLSLRDDFTRVFDEFGRALDNAEHTNSALVERTAMLDREEKEHSELKERHRELHEENERLRDELTLSKAEIEKSAELVATREKRIEEIERDIALVVERHTASIGELAEERYRADMLSQKLRSAEAEIRRNAAFITDLETKLAALSDRCAQAELQVAAVESRLAHEKLERGISETLWKERHERAEDEIGRLNSRLDAQVSRADAAELLLSEVRAELHRAGVDLRERDVEIEELKSRVAPLNDLLVEITAERQALVDQITETERARAIVDDRAEALARGMADQRSELELAKERASVLEQRLSSEANRYASEIDRLNEKLRDVREELEREKTAHTIASNALKAARDHVARQGQALSLHDILQKADEAEAEGRDGGFAKRKKGCRRTFGKKNANLEPSFKNSFTRRRF